MEPPRSTRFSVLPHLLALLLALSAAVPLDAAQAQAVLILIAPPITVGESATVAAQLNCGGMRCTTFAITLWYDPLLLRVNSLALGGYLGANAVVIEQRIDNQQGEVRFAATALGTPTPSPQDLLFTLDVTALDAGSLTFAAPRLEVGDLQPIPAVLQSLPIALLAVEPTPIPPSPIPTTFTPVPQQDTTTLRGTLIFQRDLDLYRYDAVTGISAIVTAGANYEPDVLGDWVAYAALRGDSKPDIYLYNLRTGVERQLTDTPDFDRHPAISPDGSRIAFTTDRDGNWEIYLMNMDGSGQTNVTHAPSSEYFPTWSADGQSLVFQSNRDGGTEQFFWLDLRTGGLRQITHSSVGVVGAVLSPDDQWIAGYANVDTPYWLIANVADGSIISGTRGIATDWVDGDTFLYHRLISEASDTRGIYVRDIFGSSETLLIENGLWATYFP